MNKCYNCAGREHGKCNGKIRFGGSRITADGTYVANESTPCTCDHKDT